MARKHIVLIAAVLILLLTACGDGPGLFDTWFIVPCPDGQTTIFKDNVRTCE